MSPALGKGANGLMGFPRVSGDEPGAGVQVVIPNAFSPRERG